MTASWIETALTGAHDLVELSIETFEWFIITYFLTLNTIYLVLTILAIVGFTKHIRRISHAGHDDVFANPLTPGVSIVVPAHNEEAGIVDSVRAMLSLKYPKFEVIVVEDGSKDSTFEQLQNHFDLAEIPYAPAENSIPTVGPVQSMHLARSGEPLIVVRKANGGSRADASNAGINVSTMPLVCMVDADSLLDPEALLRVVKPFMDDPKNVVATGGVILPGNGCVVDEGHVVESRIPKGWLARIQFVEYLRSFLLGRTGWSTLKSLLVISGAFGLFRRDIVMAVGGMDTNSVGEDAELVASIHHYMRDRKNRDYRVVFVAEPVCWTESPTDIKVLARQRKRWSRGLAEVLWKHRKMMFNPKYGRIGMFVMPYYLFFELLGPVVELIGFATVTAGVALGLLGGLFDQNWWLIDQKFAVMFGLVAVGYSVVLSVASLTAEEFSFHRLRSWRDFGAAMAAALLENLGYRQLHAYWRLKGLVSWLIQRDSKWGAMPRTGFKKSDKTVAKTTKVTLNVS